MITALLYLLILAVPSDTTTAPAPQVAAFDYEIALNLRPEPKSFMGFRTESRILKFKVDSVKKVPGDAAIHIIKTTIGNSIDGIEVVPATDTVFTPDKPRFPEQRPERSFYFEVKSLQFAPDDSISMRLRFKDTDEVYKLRYVKAGGLRLEAADCKFGKVGAAHVPEFVNVRVDDGRRHYQCNPLTIAAAEKGKSLWSTEIGMRGQPESLSVLEKVLFVKTTGGHSFYVMKHTGEMLLYDGSVMKGENPSDDLLSLWRRDMSQTFAQREKRGFFRFIKAAVMLDERRSIPLMIECVEHGFGLDEKCAAVAALEKFNGNPAVWPQKFPIPPSYFLKQVGMNKVFPDANAQAERKKWETVFKDQLPK